MPINTSDSLNKPEISHLYNGDVRLEFHNSGHRYKVFYKGQEIFGTRGVTTVISILDKPQLVQWAANVTNEYWLSNVKAGVDELVIKTIAKRAHLAWREKRDSAGDVGTLIHEWIERYILAKIGKAQLPAPPVNEIVQNGALKFLEWEKKNVAEFMETERKVYSLKHNIAGTCDFIYINKDNELCLGDIKTSKGIYKTFALQLAGYRYMLEEERKYINKNSTNAYKRMIIVRIDKTSDEIEVKEIGEYEKNVVSFLACNVLHKNLNK